MQIWIQQWHIKNHKLRIGSSIFSNNWKISLKIRLMFSDNSTSAKAATVTSENSTLSLILFQSDSQKRQLGRCLIIWMATVTESLTTKTLSTSKSFQCKAMLSVSIHSRLTQVNKVIHLKLWPTTLNKEKNSI